MTYIVRATVAPSGKFKTHKFPAQRHALSQSTGSFLNLPPPETMAPQTRLKSLFVPKNVAYVTLTYALNLQLRLTPQPRRASLEVTGVFLLPSSQTGKNEQTSCKNASRHRRPDGDPPFRYCGTSQRLRK